MKILAGSFQCESNTFCDNMARECDFEVFEGQRALDKLAAVKVFEQARAKVLALPYASALPSGEVSQSAFAYFRDRFVKTVAEHPDADGIYLYLHGSMYVENTGSGELALLEAIRGVIGADVPISLALDFHANVPPGLTKLVNAIHGFRTAPHTDQDDTERRAARALLKCISAGSAKTFSVHLPFVCGDAALTLKEPFVSVNELLRKLDGRPEVVSSAFFNAQPWYDAPYTGASAIVSTLDGSGSAYALELAKLFWDGRELLTLEGALDVDAAVEASLAYEDGPVFVTDSGDNTTAGAKGSGTLLLKKYVAQDARGVCVCGIFDRENTDALLALNLGAKTSVVLCRGKHGLQEQEIRLDATLKSKGTVFGWAGDEVGEGVTLACGGIDVILTNARAAFTTPEHFMRMRVNPADYKVIVLKMGYLFPRLREISSRSIFAMTPGQSTNDFSTLDYKRLRRKLYPIHKDIEWSQIEAMTRRGEL